MKMVNKAQIALNSTTMTGRIFVCHFIVLLYLLPGCKEKEISSPLYGTAPSDSIPVYRFATPEFNNPGDVMADYQPLMDYLNDNIKSVRFVLETSKDYANFEKKYQNGTPEIIRPNPWQTIQAIQSGYDVILTTGDPAGLKGLFIVRKDAEINKPSDLIGKTVSYSAPTAIAATVMTQYFLYQNGINVNRDVKNIYVGSHESALLNVYMKNSSAAGSTSIPWHDFQKNHPPEASKLKVAWETESLIMGSIMIRRDVDSAIRRQVTDCLLQLPETEKGRALLAGIHTKYFLRATNKDYDVVKQYIQRFERDVRKIEVK
ncbi:MAG: PhnD/SsuA/transferrin family substrate-binding protein [Lacibacter sp.]